MWKLLYRLLIGPLDLFFEIVYSTATGLWGFGGISLIPMSLSVSFISLPFYRRAEVIQKKEREIERTMEIGIEHIRSTFSGDERFMMLQAYYKINHYSPLSMLKSSLPLMLQIPFFISAYRFLSGLEDFRGLAWGPIADLGSPDSLITIAGLTINVLPLLMTAINLLTSTIYAKDNTRREKFQLYGMALVFLVLLYQSPSGLVLYWTFNNLFSLVRNIIDRSDNRVFLKKVLYSGLAGFIFVSALFSSIAIGEHHFAAYVASLLFIFPVISVFHRKYRKSISGDHKELNKYNYFFLPGCLFLTVLIGMLIPSAVISSSPSEFVDPLAYQSPILYIVNSLMMAAGLFIIWMGLFYLLSENRERRILNITILCLTIVSIVDYLFFTKYFGSLSPYLQYESIPSFSSMEILVNIMVLVIATAVIMLLWRKNSKFIRTVVAFAVMVAVGMSTYNLWIISTEVSDNKLPAEATSAISADSIASYTLSRENKNVIVMMLDKAVSGFLPFVFNEKPELKAQFEGFTWYPNTITYGWSTNVGSPAIYGGYEYIPQEMNRRKDEWLADKHNEALKVMPVLFSKAGYDVTVSDPPYAGYSQIPDLSIYKDYPKIHTWLTEQGQFRNQLADFSRQDNTKQKIWERNFFYYSLMKTVPLMVQNSVYQEGQYLNPNAYYTDLNRIQHTKGTSIATGVKEQSLNSFAALKALPEITNVSDFGSGAFLMLYNSTPHEPMLYQTPDYEPMLNVDNVDYDHVNAGRFHVDGRILRVESSLQMIYYHANVTTLLQLGKWFDWMRAQNIYDNTRIIIVADHGAELGCIEDYILDDGKDIMLFNPLLLVKDFDSTGFDIDYTFMTNADTPTLAFEGVIDAPENPFTGKMIDDKAKYTGEQHVMVSGSHDIRNNHGKTFLSGEWYAVHDDALNADNWSYLGKY